MTKITISTNEGIVIDHIDVDEFDLSKNFARQYLLTTILQAIDAAKIEEEKEKNEKV
jgi:hypothetical protein